MQAYKLRDIGICFDELAYRHARVKFRFLGVEIEVSLYNRFQNAGKPAERCGILLFIGMGRHERIIPLHIVAVVEHEHGFHDDENGDESDKDTEQNQKALTHGGWRS